LSQAHQRSAQAPTLRKVAALEPWAVGA